jgi:hypothetical protein
VVPSNHPFLERFLPAQRVIFDADQREAHHSSVLPFTLTTADSPCFHPHSKDSLNPWCRLAFLIFDGCCHLSAELSRPCLQKRWFRRDLAVTRTRRFATNLFYSGCCLFNGASPGIAVA